MNPTHDQPDDRVPDELPTELLDALRSLDGPPAAPSADHDAALLAQARAHLARIEPIGADARVPAPVSRRRGGDADSTTPADAPPAPYRRPWLWAVGGSLAAAAAVGIVVWIGQPGYDEASAPFSANQPEADRPGSRRPTDAGPATGGTREPVNPADPDTDPHAGLAARGETDTPGARPGTLPGALPGAGDLDGSGGIDILDAFALARAVRDDEAPARSRANDFNRDGTVDQRDADWLADRAVAVTRDGGRG